MTLVFEQGYSELFAKFTVDELYAMRDQCDKIEEVAWVIGLCRHVSEALHSYRDRAYFLVTAIFKPTTQEMIEYPDHRSEYFLGYFDIRVVAAGFLACLIDDEITSRGE